MTARLVIAVIAMVIVGALPPSPAAGQTRPDRAFDVVFIIDRSGSMINGPCPSGDCDDGRSGATDPSDLSTAAVQSGISALYSRLVEQEFAAPDRPRIDLRVGVVAFGATVAELLPLQRLTAQRVGAAFTPNLADALKNLGQPRTALGDATRYSLALGHACKMLGDDPSCTTPLDPNRTRAVILLTDSDPKPGSPSAGTLEERYRDRSSSYFDELKRRYGPLINGSSIWLLGIDSSQQLFAANRDRWVGLVGSPDQVIPLKSVNDATTTLLDITDRLFGDTAAKGACGEAEPPIGVAPYLATLVVTLTYSDKEAQAALRDPSAAELPRLADGSPPGPNQVISYSRFGLSELYIIRRPEPGGWACALISGSGQPEYRVRHGPPQSYQLALEADRPEHATTCRVSTYHAVAADIDGQPVAPRAGYPLIFDLGSARDGTYDSTAQVNQETGAIRIDPPIQGGSYVLTLTATFSNTLLAASAPTPVEVAADQPCTVAIIAPRQGDTITLTSQLQPVPVEVLVRLLRSDGTPLDAHQALLDSQPLTVTLAQPGGATTVRALRWSTEQSSFAARIADLDTSGVYTLALPLSTAAAIGLPAEQRPEPVVFTRPYEPIWLIIRRSLVALGLLLLILLAAALGLLVALIGGRPPRGVLLLRSPSAEGGRWETRAGFPLSARPRPAGLTLSLIQIRESEIPESLPIRRMFIRQDGEGISVYVQPRAGRSHWQSLGKDSGAVELDSLNVQLVYHTYEIVPVA